MLRTGLNLLFCQRSDTTETQAMSTGCRCFPSADTPHPGGSSQGCTPCLEVSTPLHKICSEGLRTPLWWWDASWALSLSLCFQNPQREQSTAQRQPGSHLSCLWWCLLLLWKWVNQAKALLVYLPERGGEGQGEGAAMGLNPGPAEKPQGCQDSPKEMLWSSAAHRGLCNTPLSLFSR